MRRTATVLFALLAIALLVAPVSVAVAQDVDTAGNATTNGEFTLSELKADGPRQANSPSGVRMGSQQLYWAVYWPANALFADPGSVEGGEHLAPGTTIGRNSVYLRTWTYEDREQTIHVAYWQRGSRTVTTGNTTTTEPVAENVTHVTHEVTFDRGRPTVEIPLQQHDTPVQVTMWIEGADYARWRFTHHSVATTQAVNIDSAGDYLAQVIVDFLLVIVAGGFAVGWAVKRALDRAGIGPQYGYAPWLVSLTILTGLGGALAYQSLADLVVTARYVLALYVVGIIGIVMLETYTTNISTALFLRPTLEYAEDPTGEEAFDIIDMEGRTERVVRSPDGSVSVVKKGLFPFLARVFGKSARLANAEQLRTRVPMTNSPWDELFLVDPEAEQLLFFEPAGWELDFPPVDREHAAEYGFVAAGVGTAMWALSQGVGSAWGVGAVTVAGVAIWALRPVDGLAAVRPAPVHLRTAFGSMVAYAEDVDDAKHFDDLKSKLKSEQVSKQRDVDREVANHDATLVSEMLDPDSDVPAAVEPDGDAEDVTDRGENTPRPPDAVGGDDD